MDGNKQHNKVVGGIAICTQAMKNRAYHEGIKCSPYEGSVFLWNWELLTLFRHEI